MCRFKDGKEVKSSKKLDISYLDHDASLTIKKTENKDAGTYKVTAVNKIGQVECECKVAVQGT